MYAIYHLAGTTTGHFGASQYRPLSRHQNALNYSLYRFAWDAVSTWIILACMCGFGGLPGM
jgi:hypothetical protein